MVRQILKLTHCGLVMPYCIKGLSQQWLVAWRHQAFMWTIVDLSSVRSSNIYLRAISIEIPQLWITNISLKITYVNFHWNLPEATVITKLPDGWVWYSAEWVGWGPCSKVVTTFSHLGRSLHLFMATQQGCLNNQSFRIWDHVLHVEHISCVITNCGQHQWVIPSPLSTAL